MFAFVDRRAGGRPDRLLLLASGLLHLQRHGPLGPRRSTTRTTRTPPMAMTTTPATPSSRPTTSRCRRSRARRPWPRPRSQAAREPVGDAGPAGRAVDRRGAGRLRLRRPLRGRPSRTSSGAARSSTRPTNHVLHEAHDAADVGEVAPLVASIIGLLIAVYVYLLQGNERPGREARRPQRAAVRLLLQQVVLRRAVPGHLRARGQGPGRPVLEGRRPEDHRRPRARRRLAPSATTSASRTGRLQSGYVYHYAFVMLLGVAGSAGLRPVRACH